MAKGTLAERTAWRENSYDASVTCHDHFDGSAHCVECVGRCKLTGADMAFTALVREMFEGAEYSGAVLTARGQLERSGVPVEKFRERAKASRYRGAGVRSK